MKCRVVGGEALRKHSGLTEWDPGKPTESGRDWSRSGAAGVDACRPEARDGQADRAMRDVACPTNVRKSIENGRGVFRRR
eukprot:11417094-Alexandrium_andersonii.AAC.1